MVLGPEGEGDADVALVAAAEDGGRVEFTRADLRREVARGDAALRRRARAGRSRGAAPAQHPRGRLRDDRGGADGGDRRAALFRLRPEAIATRVNAAGARMLVTCDGYLRGGKTILTGETVEAVVRSCASLEVVAVVDCLGTDIGDKAGATCPATAPSRRGRSIRTPLDDHAHLRDHGQAEGGRSTPTAASRSVSPMTPPISSTSERGTGCSGAATWAG
jgi:hypothetical protein